MHVINNLKKYRNLPITSLLTGTLSYTTLALRAIKTLFFSYLYNDIASKIFSTVFVSILGLILPITAIICGSIDLTRIKKGLHNIRLFKAFDIMGIIFGSIIFLMVIIFNFGPIIMLH